MGPCCRISCCGPCSARFRRSSPRRDRCGCSCASGRSPRAPRYGIDAGFPVAVGARMATIIVVTTTGSGVGRTHVSSPQSARWFCIGLVTWFVGSPKRDVVFATYICRPVTCSPPARYSRRPCLTFGEALGGETPNVQPTHHSMKGRVIPELSMLRRVQKVCEPFPHYPLVAGSLIDHRLVRERTRREFRAVRPVRPERRSFAGRIRLESPRVRACANPRSPEYRSPPAPRRWPQAAGAPPTRAGEASPA